MKTTFIFTSQLAAAAGCDKICFESEAGETLLKITRALAKNYKAKFNDILFSDDKFSPTIMVVVNGNQVLDKNDVLLNEDSEVMFITPMAGG